MEKNGLFSQRIRLRHLHTFVAVAQQGTLGRAAETLNLSQPALSKTLNELEQLTGTRLFDRGRLGAQLTRGEQFLTHAVKVLDAQHRRPGVEP
jgi:DNA-binding transcriptional LysR family regulator